MDILNEEDAEDGLGSSKAQPLSDLFSTVKTVNKGEVFPPSHCPCEIEKDI